MVEANLDRAIATATATRQRLRPDEPLAPGSSLTAAAAVDLFEDQATSRALDVQARRLRAQGIGYYTISSAGHEMNAVLGALTRPTDPAFLHYRSGGFMLARGRQAPGSDVVGQTLRSLTGSSEDAIAQGRHKVWGSRELWVPPQTSTIASHLPKAVGTAFALDLRLSTAHATDDPPADGIVVCSFGDASTNHATAQATFNAARYTRRLGRGVPILFVCEDNGIGISVDTPRGWIAQTFRSQRHLRYVLADGEVDEVWAAVDGAVTTCRQQRRPVFLHLPTVRLWGHAGSDVESAYRSMVDIVADEERDPLVRTARRLVALGAATSEELSELVARVRQQVVAGATEAPTWPKLTSRDEIAAPLHELDHAAVVAAAGIALDEETRRGHFGGTLPEEQTAAVRRTLASHVNATLHDELLARSEAVVLGQDVARKGGVYHVTAGLTEGFGPQRVFDTLLDETTILGTAQGLGLIGFLPVPEIQYLAYVHNALDQIRGEAASLSFFSSGQFRNPMVVRIASFAYQKGFGGHFHNDNAIGALREIPGLLLATPSRGDDAARLLRACTAIAAAHGRVVCFLEPIALYHERDLYEDGDAGWLTDYPPPGDLLLPGEVGSYGPTEADVLIVTYANGVRLSLRAARRLEADAGVGVRVIDLRWLNPLPWQAIEEAAVSAKHVVVVDECRATGAGVADAILAHLAERGVDRPVASVRAADSYVPLGPLADHVLVQEDDIVAAAHALVAT